MQLPLDLAWAMSVHKSQGMTLDRWGPAAEPAGGTAAGPSRQLAWLCCVPVALCLLGWQGWLCSGLLHPALATGRGHPYALSSLLLCRVEVSLERAFEPGMAYVALSRVKALEGLRILGGIAPQALRAGACGGLLMP